jgi:predicted metal-binding protein
MTGCLTCIKKVRQGFEMYEQAELVGVFTCTCPGDDLPGYARILRKKGAEAIHLVTCAFSHKEDGQWVNGHGLCGNLDRVFQKMAEAVDMPCVKGTAHLPEGYVPEILHSPAG